MWGHSCDRLPILKKLPGASLGAFAVLGQRRTDFRALTCFRFQIDNTPNFGIIAKSFTLNHFLTSTKAFSCPFIENGNIVLRLFQIGERIFDSHMFRPQCQSKISS
jgi:hypothetical protein